MKNWCKYCGKEITKTDNLIAIWSDLDGYFLCNQGIQPGLTLTKRDFHTPLAEENVVDRILTKYQDGSN